MPAYSNNLILANRAKEYANSKTPRGSANRLTESDMVSTFSATRRCVADARDFEISYSSDGIPPKLRSIASRAEAAGCGNCTEVSAIAFLWLYDNRYFPIDWMKAQDAVDHIWVVLGRTSGSEVARPATWGNAAVICDPWDDRCYPASDFTNQMYKGDISIPILRVRATSATNVTRNNWE